VFLPPQSNSAFARSRAVKLAHNDEFVAQFGLRRLDMAVFSGLGLGDQDSLDFRGHFARALLMSSGRLPMHSDRA